MTCDASPTYPAGEVCDHRHRTSWSFQGRVSCLSATGHSVRSALGCGTPCRVKWWNARLWKLLDENWSISFLVCHFVDISRVFFVCLSPVLCWWTLKFFYLGHLKNFYTIQYNTKKTIPATPTDGEKSPCRVLKSGFCRGRAFVVSTVQQTCPGRHVLSRCPTVTARAAAAPRGRMTSECDWCGLPKDVATWVGPFRQVDRPEVTVFCMRQVVAHAGEAQDRWAR